MPKTNKISFLLGNQQVCLDLAKEQIRLDTTVLQYLRAKTSRKSVKEGCAEGDCGACTVVLAEPEGKFLKYRAINSCITFLPSLHGKQLITTEDLGNSQNLHVIQEAMVEKDASQCGFCTPGFTMSIFGLYKNRNEPDLSEIKEALAGNLCRCTGYRPIIDAAQDACVYKGMDRFTGLETLVYNKLAAIGDKKESLEIITDKQKYFLPTSLEEALKLRAQMPAANLVNGASDVALRVTKRKEILAQVIDLSQVKDLKGMKITTKEVEIGAGETLERIRIEIQDIFPALHTMLNVFGSLQIRNSAAIGGNIGSASPIGDTLPVLMAYNASVEVTNNKKKKRIFLLKDFIIDYRKTQLFDNELITKIIIPLPAEGFMVLSYKSSKRKDLDISTVSAGFGVQLKDSIVQKISLFYGGMSAFTKNAVETEKFLLNKKWTRENIESAVNLLQKDFQPLSDARATAEGRLQIAKNLLLKFWSETKY